MSDELVTGAEIARRLGVSRVRVHQWATDPKYGFPLSLGRFGAAKVWRWEEVEQWAAGRGLDTHIALVDFVALYRPAFPNEESAARFVSCVEAVPGAAPAKILLHQAGRMVWLADRINDVAAGRPALQILFYIIAAEAIAKIFYGYQGDGESKAHVRKFFEEICSEEHRARLGEAFTELRDDDHGIPDEVPLTVSQAVDVLYDIRCDVVHEGRYFGLSLKEDIPMLWIRRDRTLTSHISLWELRLIVIEGAILACKKKLPPDAGYSLTIKGQKAPGP